MNYITAEQAGVSSGKVKEFIQRIENAGLTTHDVILAKGNDIFFEKYWTPFEAGQLHRMYSVSKSFVSIAVGFAEQDGLLDLDAPMIKYFPDELKNQTDEYLRNQTVRHMLMMSTAKRGRNWFAARTDDRVRHYFENDNPQTRPSGTIYEYDSSGSFVLGALVERVTGKPFMEYLREKFFDTIGVSKEAHCLKCPGGHSWGDSAVLCTPIDLLLVARFMLNKGKWNGVQILNEDYAVKATTKQVENNYFGTNEFDKKGYGYQFWMTFGNAFFFNGMGAQFAVCVPEKDIILIYNGDNQGKANAKTVIFESFFDCIIGSAQDSVLPENKKAQDELEDACRDLKIPVVQGEKHCDFEKEINGVTYNADPNPMGIKKFRLVFEENNGRLEYTNEQGDKTLYFGLGDNEIATFPQEGYSDEVGSVRADGHYYRCAASAAWVEEQKIIIRVQIIDEYFGNLNITIGFRDDYAGIMMHKVAEDFLDEYEGVAGAKKA